MKLKLGRAAGVFVGLLMMVATSYDAHADVSLCGSTTVQKRIMEPMKDAFEKSAGMKMTISGSGTGKGLEALIKGECDAAMASEELADAVKSMKDATGREAPADLQPHLLAKDNIKVIVNHKNQVSRLSQEQLKGLHTGKIANWKEVGGTDAPVIVVTSHPGSATRLVFQKVIMGNEPYVKDAIQAKTTREEIEDVALYDEAIGAVSEGFLLLPEYKGKVKTVEAPEISRPLMLITKGAPSPEVKKVIDFVAGEGKQFIR